jgi:hypothetical protein
LKLSFGLENKNCEKERKRCTYQAIFAIKTALRANFLYGLRLPRFCHEENRWLRKLFITFFTLQGPTTKCTFFFRNSNLHQNSSINPREMCRCCVCFFCYQFSDLPVKDKR